MSEPRSPLQQVWSASLLLLGTVIVLTFALWLLSKIWLVLLLLALGAGLLFAGFQWLRSRRGRW